MTLEDINKNGVMSLDISEATAEDLDVLYEYYANILKASKEKVEQLRSEVKESWSVIDGLEADEKKYAIAGDEKAYMKARYRHDMHKERIAAHESFAGIPIKPRMRARLTSWSVSTRWNRYARIMRQR